MRTILASALLVVACGACGSREPEPNGIGPYVLGKTRLVDGKISFRCEPGGELTHCFGGPEVAVGTQAAQVDLYFAGTGDDAPLAEIFLSVRACRTDEVGQAMAQALGPPGEQAETRMLWNRKLVFVEAKLPAPGGSACELSFVDPKDTKRVAELKAGR